MSLPGGPGRMTETATRQVPRQRFRHHPTVEQRLQAAHVLVALGLRRKAQVDRLGQQPARLIVYCQDSPRRRLVAIPAETHVNALGTCQRGFATRKRVAER